MTDDNLYKQAMKDVKELVNTVMEQCKEFADEYDYEKFWVADRFREEFNKAVRKINNDL